MVTVNFNGPNAVNPVTAPLTIANLGADQAAVAYTYRTANRTAVAYAFDNASTALTRTIAGFPQFPGSFHVLQVSAAPNLQTYDRLRTAGVVFGAVAARTVTLGPDLGAVNVTTLSTSPTLRLQAFIPTSQPYHQAWSLSGTQGSGAQARTTVVQMTAGWVASVPPIVTIDMPDFTTAGGYLPDWGLRDGVATSWSTVGQSSSGLAPQGQPAEGATLLSAGRFGTRPP
jgi:hypothetical protein